MDRCIRCNSERLMGVYGKTSDLCMLTDHRGREYDGYVPSDIGLGGDSDAIDLTYCLDCGQIQDNFPISNEALDEYFLDEDEYEVEPVVRNMNDELFRVTYDRLKQMAENDKDMTEAQMRLYVELAERYENV